MNQPKISVVMSIYNSAKYLKLAIDSVLNQTFTDFELIIIDDGSIDDGADIVKTYSDSRIRYMYQSNQGLAAALNAAIASARADLIARMDPDDICFPDRLEKEYAYLCAHSNVVIVGSAAMCIDAEGHTLGLIHKPSYEKENSPLPETPCIHPSVLFRLSTFQQAGGYMTDMRYGGEDAVLFNSMLNFGAVANLTEPLMYYRLHPSSMSQKSRRFNRLLRQQIRKEVMKLSVSEKEQEDLKKEYQLSGSGSFGYNLYVGKLLIKNNDVKAWRYFFSAIQENPLSMYAWLCLLLSCFSAVRIKK